MINRDSYLNRLVRHRWNGEIKVITGIRRCGKSVLLFDLFYEYLLSQGVADDHIIKSSWINGGSINSAILLHSASM